MLAAKFYEDSVEFFSYPFRPSSVFWRPIVASSLIKDVDLSKSPPELRLQSGEILFVSETQSKELEHFATRLGLPIVTREDVWADLLMPFLDTQLPLSCHKHALLRLKRCGFSRAEVRQIRNRVKTAMLLYNSFVWEWVHLGLLDVLEAVNRLSWRWTFKRFYFYAMEVANRAP
jgi:hypothetical protein